MKKTIIPFLLAGMLTAFAVIHTNEKAIKETDSYSTIQAKIETYAKKEEPSLSIQEIQKDETINGEKRIILFTTTDKQIGCAILQKNYLNRYQIEYISTQEPAQIEDKSALSSIYT